MSRKPGILWTAVSLSDLREARDYISLDNPKAAARLAAKIRQRIVALATYPLSGRVVPEFQNVFLREVIVPPYRIIYLIEKPRIIVLRVWHAHRNLPDTLDL